MMILTGIDNDADYDDNGDVDKDADNDGADDDQVTWGRTLDCEELSSLPGFPSTLGTPLDL